MIYLHGLGHFYPENVITNRFLSDLDIGSSSEEWIEERVGIRERHTVLPLEYIRETKNRDVRAAQEASLYTNGQTAAAAARMAIERAGITVADIGMVISGSSAPDVASPAEASTVAAQLGIDVPAFDMNSACTSFRAADPLSLEHEPGGPSPVYPDHAAREPDALHRLSRTAGRHASSATGAPPPSCR